MVTKILNPRKALNRAFLKLKPIRLEIDIFKSNLTALLNSSNDSESEEYHKNLISDFLKNTYYKQNHFINTKGRNDLVIHVGNGASSPVGVIIETKKTANKAEMITCDNINKKALHELILYYLRERITQNNIEIKHLIVTNINEWFIFDAQIFNVIFAENKSFVKQFTDFEEERLAGQKTDFFYKHIAEPFISNIDKEIEFTYFNINDYQLQIRNSNKESDHLLIALFKIFSPEHLLKLPFANDSNSLDNLFYGELLHILGLTETKHAGKKLIERKTQNERHQGSLLENTIEQLQTLDKLPRIDKIDLYGTTQQEQLFGVGLELTITWINRILFLKLLEAQLVSYHKGDLSYSFLNTDKVRNFDDLGLLFFQILAKKNEDRSSSVAEKFKNVPYLNSSLFEISELEQICFSIGQLRTNEKMPLQSNTVLKSNTGKKLEGEMNTLAYLFRFLDAYDFGAEGQEAIQEDNKTLINASVLGLIFEKINGYKEGSFFTPGFITMYMCRETISKAIVQKFKEYGQTNHLSSEKIDNLEDISELIPKKISKKEANEVINSLKICDPAVGSGHFLVSALNEIIALKSELGILLDSQGKSLKDLSIKSINDTLYITDAETDQEFYYLAPSPRSDKTMEQVFGKDHFKSTPTFVTEKQRIQETLFREKQTIIENCLFGVDINPNSVKICRLRLWIELLKNAHYTQQSNFSVLETLPNIDINIKCGNSLISRFGLDADISQALKKSKWTIDTYKTAVETYRNAQNKEQKREMERLINEIKSTFAATIGNYDPRKIKLAKLGERLYKLTGRGRDGFSNMVFEPQEFYGTNEAYQKLNQEIDSIEKEISKIDTEIEAYKNNKIYDNAFEWRFEFPEVLNNNGDFIGFDVVIANPPYISISRLKSNIQNYFSEKNYQTFTKNADLYCLFIELAKKVGNKNGLNHFVVSNKWLTASYGLKTRTFLSENTSNIFIIDFNKFQVFNEASVDTCLISFSNKNGKTTDYVSFDIKDKSEKVNDFLKNISLSTKKINLTDNWNLGGFGHTSIKDKISLHGKILSLWNIKFYRGITTGFNEAFVIDKVIKDKLIDLDKKNNEVIKPLLKGRDIKKYKFEKGLQWLINTHNGLKSDNINPIDVSKSYPSIFNHLQSYKNQLTIRIDKGEDWTNLRNCAYLKEFEKEKLVFTKASKVQAFAYDNMGHFVLNTSYILTGEKLKYLLALLNSKLIHFAFKYFYQSGGIEGEITIQAIEQIPIAIPSQKIELKITSLVENILQTKQNPNADTSALEQQIDQLVYQLYELTDEEIKMIEESSIIKN